MAAQCHRQQLSAGAIMDVETFLALGLDQRSPRSVNGRGQADFNVSLNPPADRVYHPCPEAYPGENIPKGTIAHHANWTGSQVFAGTERDIWVYQPAGSVPVVGANLAIFMDGEWYQDGKGPVRVCQVLDTLISKGRIPPTIAVFVSPGRPTTTTAALPDPKAELQRMLVRSNEYDSLSFVTGAHGLSLSDDPARRLACGISSGGICAFTMAWQFPQAFGCVLSHCGSFVNILGGHNYDYLVRSTPRKPIRVFLQSGENDASFITGSWPLANQGLARALEFAGYDYRFEFGVGGHSLRHGGALMADSLIWFWGNA
jgi:enterochelin esterase-like enzyme